MSRLQGFLYAVRSFFRRDAADRETAEEIAFHIERQTRKHIEHDVPPDEARRRALAEFGGAGRSAATAFSLQIASSSISTLWSLICRAASPEVRIDTLTGLRGSTLCSLRRLRMTVTIS